jgi:hypothetical protein
MKLTPVREKDGGPIINWLADRINWLGCSLVTLSSPYALMYRAELDDEE